MKKILAIGVVSIASLAVGAVAVTDRIYWWLRRNWM